MKGTITDIKRFAVHDGDGIRTTVFFKGCPLRCVWCHNPESLSSKKQLAFYRHKCTNCGACEKICSANSFFEGEHSFMREECTLCGKCNTICPNEALKIYGKQMSVEDVLDAVMRDKDFYAVSGGGVTISGGECLLQSEFCAEILKECKENGINTAVDTCGYVKKEAIDRVLPYTDVFLYDLKAFDEAVHIKCTGVSNRIILENLRYIDNLGKKIEIRIPYIPEYNDDQLEGLAEVIKGLKNIVRVKLLPYHNYANSRYEALGIENTMKNVRIPTEAECNKLMSEYMDIGR